MQLLSVSIFLIFNEAWKVLSRKSAVFSRSNVIFWNMAALIDQFDPWWCVFLVTIYILFKRPRDSTIFLLNLVSFLFRLRLMSHSPYNDTHVPGIIKLCYVLCLIWCCSFSRIFWNCQLRLWILLVFVQNLLSAIGWAARMVDLCCLLRGRAHSERLLGGVYCVPLLGGSASRMPPCEGRIKARKHYGKANHKYEVVLTSEGTRKKIVEEWKYFGELRWVSGNFAKSPAVAVDGSAQWSCCRFVCTSSLSSTACSNTEQLELRFLSSLNLKM